MPYTKAQIVNLGIQLVSNTHDFQDGLKTWLSKPEDQKIWENFKTHFEEEHNALREIRGMSMMHTCFHQANYVSDQVLEEVESVQQNVIHLLQKYDDQTNPETSTESTAHDSSISQLKEDKAFATTSEPSTWSNIISILQQMQKEIHSLKMSSNHATKTKERGRKNTS